jgi:hypothetical protein
MKLFVSAFPFQHNTIARAGRLWPVAGTKVNLSADEADPAAGGIGQASYRALRDDCRFRLYPAGDVPVAADPQNQVRVDALIDELESLQRFGTPLFAGVSSSGPFAGHGLTQEQVTKRNGCLDEFFILASP